MDNLDISSRLELQVATTNWSNGGSRMANLPLDAKREIEILRGRIGSAISEIDAFERGLEMEWPH